MTTPHNKPSKGLSPDRGFTLIELLVIIAVTAILAARLLPSRTPANRKAPDLCCLRSACPELPHQITVPVTSPKKGNLRYD